MTPLPTKTSLGLLSDTEPKSVTALRECIELQLSKAKDYQNPASRVKQAMYYPDGAKTILDIMHAKQLRMRSILEAMEHDISYKPNHEALEDSAKDLINYASFFVSWLRMGIPGQENGDPLNRKSPWAAPVTVQTAVSPISCWSESK